MLSFFEMLKEDWVKILFKRLNKYSRKCLTELLSEDVNFVHDQITLEIAFANSAKCVNCRHYAMCVTVMLGIIEYKGIVNFTEDESEKTITNGLLLLDLIKW